MKMQMIRFQKANLTKKRCNVKFWSHILKMSFLVVGKDDCGYCFSNISYIDATSRMTYIHTCLHGEYDES
jgi:hypothetical protein